MFSKITYLKALLEFQFFFTLVYRFFLFIAYSVIKRLSLYV